LADQRSNKARLKSPSVRERQRKLLTPKAVIFDIGRVIVRLDPRRAFAPISAMLQRAARRSETSLSPQNTWELIRSDERWHDWQEGRISSGEWHEHLMRRLKLPLSYEEFRDAWNRVLDPDPILSEDLFVRLAARCRLALLSNTDPIHVACLEESFALGRHFPVRIYSCTVGVSKPSPAIYRAALNALGVSAQEALYIDDLQEFVLAARQVGMDAIQFKTAALLERDLRKRHLP
jgi:HAD superfamily hydrolase (TIGR01509 family)